MWENERVPVPTSTNDPPRVSPPPQTVTHVYTKEHNTKGLQPGFRGPFEVISRPTRSTVKIKVGVNKDGSNREQVRSWGDTKPAYLRSDAEPAERPKRGRPSKKPPASSTTSKSHQNSSGTDASSNQNIATTTTEYSPNLAAIDFSAGNSKLLSTAPEPFKLSGPPPSPGFSKRPSVWSASQQDLDFINQSIAGSPVRCETRG